MDVNELIARCREARMEGCEMRQIIGDLLDKAEATLLSELQLKTCREWVSLVDVSDASESELRDAANGAECLARHDAAEKIIATIAAKLAPCYAPLADAMGEGQ